MSSALKKPPLSTTTSGLSLGEVSREGGDFTSKRTTGRQEKRSAAQNTDAVTGFSVEDSDMPWCQKHSPVSVSDLAVHKKKVAEVQQWLEFALSTPAGQLMLLLVGPPGCGKTATVTTLAQDMGCTILEWANPVTDVGGSEAEPQPGDLVVYSESQTRLFHSFLVRANRYPALQLGVATSGCGPVKKIVIVEDFPNAFLRDPRKFHEIIRSLAPSLHHPLVFIVSDSHQRDSSAHNLFSKSHTPLDVHTISFNPVAHTALVKTLQRIADSECTKTSSSTAAAARDRRGLQRYQLPPREVIERLAESSVGDIRSAINALQFTCRTGEGGVEVMKGQKSGRLKRTRSGSSSSTTKMRRHTSSDGGSLAAIGGRDNSLFLFRALGKILYCKRETTSDREGGEGEGEGAPRGSAVALPPHLRHHQRPRLLVDPEWVVEHSHLSPEMFVLYLHQNYLHMHSDIDNIVRGSEYLSGSDVTSTFWTDSQSARASLLAASCSLACRGLLHASEYTAAEGGGGGGGNKWRPLHKPQWISVNRTYRDKCQTAKRLFLHLGQSPHAHLWTPVELQTEILPHLALTNMPLRNPDQAALLQSITHFSHSYIR
jgi:cell cycle checkpoint protein